MLKKINTFFLGLHLGKGEAIGVSTVIDVLRPTPSVVSESYASKNEIEVPLSVIGKHPESIGQKQQSGVVLAGNNMHFGNNST